MDRKTVKQKNSKTSLLIGVLVCLCFSVLVSRGVSAFSLQPALFDISLKPGETYTANISVVNDENSERTYYLSIQKFFPKGESGQQEFLPLSDISGLPSWLSVTQPFVTLKPGESRAIPFIIRVPLDAPAGGHYAAVFFSTESPLQKPEGKIVTGARTGTLIFLTIEGQLSSKLVVEDFSATPTAAPHLPILFHLRLSNAGNIHTIPRGSIVIKNYFGSVAARVPINALEARILPNSVRTLSAVWEKAPPKSTQGFWSTLEEEWRNFALGRYTATIEISDTPSVASQTFSIWPWHLLLFLLGLLLILLIFLSLYKKWVVHRATLR